MIKWFCVVVIGYNTNHPMIVKLPVVAGEFACYKMESKINRERKLSKATCVFEDARTIII